MAKKKSARANPALRLMFIRQVHVWISVFVAPSLIFFAATGALQTFRIPDRPTSPVLIQKLARLHKDDVFAVKPPRPKRPEGLARGKAETRAKPQPKASTEVMKWFFTAVSIGIVFSSLFGLWMALAHTRQKLVVWALLIAGVAAPVLILAL